ncbi:MAG: hypothetical protein HY909_26385 [Deltaproteobacteria bacterium]|nr:hypothetical protein [Deltaproteobacteria bacterium]
MTRRSTLGDGHDDHGGLRRDLEALARLQGRRGVLRLFVGAASAGLLVACGSTPSGADAGGDAGAGGDTTPGGDTAPATDASATCTTIPQETAGPYPGDGTNSANGSVANVLTQTGVVRSDLRPSFGGLSGTAEGVPMTVRLRLRRASDCAALAGAAVYLWHCDREGRYSLYSAGVTTQNYLRGVQVADADGVVTFRTIFPGCYDGRMPHIHFEVFRALAEATTGRGALRTSQLALPLDACNAAYATTGYGASVTNLARISFERDMVFSDGYALQLASITGDAASGYVATLEVTVAA